MNLSWAPFLIFFFIKFVNTKNSSTRIVNGMPAEPAQFRFAVAMTTKTSYDPICSAVLLTGLHALTAAHCIDDDSPFDRRIIAGDLYPALSNEGKTPRCREERCVVNFQKHPLASSKCCDLAVVKLNKPITPSKNIGFVPIATDQLKERTLVITLGFGRNEKNDNESSRKLRFGIFPVTRKNCSDNGGTSYSIRKNSIGQYPVYEDVGGPLINIEPPYRCYGICAGGEGDLNTYVDTAQSRRWILNSVLVLVDPMNASSVEGESQLQGTVPVACLLIYAYLW